MASISVFNRSLVLTVRFTSRWSVCISFLLPFRLPRLSVGLRDEDELPVRHSPRNTPEAVVVFLRDRLGACGRGSGHSRP